MAALRDYRNYIFFGTLFAFTVLLIYGGMREQASYQVYYAEAKPPGLVPSNGGKLEINYRAKASRQCPTDVEITIMDPKRSAVVWGHRAPAVNLSATEWTREVTIPALPVGSYEYYSVFRTRCSEDRTFVSAAPMVKFEVR